MKCLLCVDLFVTGFALPACASSMAACLCSRPVTGGQQCLVRERSLTRDACVLETWTTVGPGTVSLIWAPMQHIQQYCWCKNQVEKITWRSQTEDWVKALEMPSEKHAGFLSSTVSLECPLLCLTVTFRQGGGWQLYGDAADVLPTCQQVQRGRPSRCSAAGSPTSARHHPGGTGQVCLVSGPLTFLSL